MKKYFGVFIILVALFSQTFSILNPLPDDEDLIEVNGELLEFFLSPLNKNDELVNFKLRGLIATFQDYSTNKDTAAAYLKKGAKISIHILKKDTSLLTQNKSIKNYSLVSNQTTILTVKNKLKQEGFIHHRLIPLITLLAIVFGVRMIKNKNAS